MRPSELLGIHGTYEAWCLDEAAYIFGMECEDVMESARAKKGSQQQKAARADNALRKMLGLEMKFRPISDLKGKG